MQLGRRRDEHAVAISLTAAATRYGNISCARRCDFSIVNFNAVAGRRTGTVAGTGNINIAAGRKGRTADDAYSDIVAGTGTAAAGNLDIAGCRCNARSAVDLHAVIRSTGRAAATRAADGDFSSRRNNTRGGVHQHTDTRGGRSTPSCAV